MKSNRKDLEQLNALGFDLDKAREIGKKYYGKKEEKPIEEPQQESPIILPTETPREKDNYLWIPNLQLWISKERYYLNNNWNSCKEKLHSQNERMPTISEFREFLNYTKVNAQDIYKEITEVKNPWRSEWLDANFKLENNELFIYYHEFDSNGKIIPKKIKLDNNTLRENKLPGISLDSWLTDATPQGLPKKGIAKGDLYYWQPGIDNNSVARFSANSHGAVLSCYGVPSSVYDNLGVRAVRR